VRPAGAARMSRSPGRLRRGVGGEGALAVSASEPSEPTEAEEPTEPQARQLRNGIITLSVLAVLVVALIFAVPGLHGVGRVVTRMTPGWLAAAVVFQILSCVGYILIFLLVFDRTPLLFGARVALTELAFGSAVSLGGAGSLAVGAWLLHGRELSLGEIAERSAVLFLVTTLINAITLVLAGLALGLGILPGPTDPLLTLLPAGLVIVAVAALLAVPRASDRFAMARGTGRRAALARLPVVQHRRDVGLLPRHWVHAADHGDRSCLPDRLARKCAPGPGERRGARGKLRRNVRALRCEGDAGRRGVCRLPRDNAVDHADLGNDRLHPPAAPSPPPPRTTRNPGAQQCRVGGRRGVSLSTAPRRTLLR
jgi:hypothetical protein